MTEKEALKESLAPCTETPVTSKISGRGKKKKKKKEIESIYSSRSWSWSRIHFVATHFSPFKTAQLP